MPGSYILLQEAPNHITKDESDKALLLHCLELALCQVFSFSGTMNNGEIESLLHMSGKTCQELRAKVKAIKTKQIQIYKFCVRMVRIGYKDMPARVPA
jgi:hypothetical protein